MIDTIPDCDHWTEMRDETGQRIAPTDYERRLRCGDSLSNEGRRIQLTIQPRGSVADEVDLAPLFVFSRPGSRYVSVQRRIPKELGAAPVKSNALTINLIP
jgi:hypothetical protein